MAKDGQNVCACVCSKEESVPQTNFISEKWATSSERQNGWSIINGNFLRSFIFEAIDEKWRNQLTQSLMSKIAFAANLSILHISDTKNR